MIAEIQQWRKDDFYESQIFYDKLCHRELS